MIGILGGTFDPIHFGHLRTALDVQQALGLSEIRLIPLRDPPHRERPHSTPEQRLQLVTTAVAGDARFRVDPRELERPGKSYTVDTLQSLREELTDTPLCLLLGGDAFNGFADWHQPERILQLAHLVVMQRPGAARPTSYPERLTTNPLELQLAPAGRILLQPVTQLEISSTQIRQMLAEQISPDYLLPAACLELIRQLGLYGTVKNSSAGVF